MRVGINGFGRIGRLAFRAGWNNPEIEFVHINEIKGGVATAAHLLEFDSVHGRWHKNITVKEDKFILDGKTVTFSEHSTPQQVPWADLGVDLVIESSGKFRTPETLNPYFEHGVKKVVVAAPVKEKALNIVVGVNDHLYNPEKHHLLTAASCTTNCISPVIQVISNEFGIENALMTTIHGYTSTQNLVDGPNKNLRRARAAAENIIPSTTGAAIATTKVIDNLNNKFDGIAFRVPVPTGSVSDITMLVSNDVSVEQINQVLINASNEDRFQGILTTTTEAIVSTDIIGDYHSAIIDLELTKVVGRLVKVVAWYDNEWGYSNRLSEMVELI